MSKMSKQMEWHMQGFAKACVIAKTQGIDALEQEIKFRNLTQVPITVSQGDVDRATRHIAELLQEKVLILACAVLHDEFGFGKKRVQQFMDRFDSKAECIQDGFVSFNDYVDTLNEELQIKLVKREDE